jgi:hypothetical protein
LKENIRKFELKQMLKMKIITRLLLLIIIATCHNAFAQKQNNQWRFGNGGGIDFNTIPPGNVSGSAITTPEGSASVADRTTGARKKPVPTPLIPQPCFGLPDLQCGTGMTKQSGCRIIFNGFSNHLTT